MSLGPILCVFLVLIMNLFTQGGCISCHIDALGCNVCCIPQKKVGPRLCHNICTLVWLYTLLLCHCHAPRFLILTLKQPARWQGAP